MPFTSPHLDDEEEVRHQAASMFMQQMGQQAAGQIHGALANMQDLAQRSQQRQDVQAQRDVENKRADAELRLHEAEGQRAASADARATATANAENTERTQKLQLEADAAKKKKRDDIIDQQIEAGIVNGTAPDEIASHIRDIGPETMEVGTNEVIARYNDHKRARAFEQQKADEPGARLEEEKRFHDKQIGVDYARIAGENERAKIAAAASANKQQPLSDAGAGKIADLKTQIDQIDVLAKEKGEINTGRLANLGNSIAQAMGMDDPKYTAFRAQTAALRDDILHALSGAAISPSEMGRLIEGIPTAADDDNAYVAKLTATRQRLALALRNRIDVEKASGHNVGSLSLTDQPSDAARIRVRRKDGQVGTILESDFDPAKYERL